MNYSFLAAVALMVPLIAFGSGTARASQIDRNYPITQIVPTLTLSLTPVGTGEGLTVDYTISRASPSHSVSQDSKSLFVLRWDTLSPTPGRSTDVVKDLQVKDGRGRLTMTPTTDSSGNYILYTSHRAPSGPVSVHYHVPVADPSAPNGRGPHREMVAAGGGIVTSGDGILLLPKFASKIDLRLRWKVSSGSFGVSSLGSGDVATRRDEREILNSFYLAGPLRAFQSASTVRGFTAFGLGSNDVDMPALFAWSAKQFQATRAEFHGDPDTTFRAFYRSYEGGPLDSGRADPNGILLYIAPRHSESGVAQSLHSLMAHEIIHVFQPDISDGDDDLWLARAEPTMLPLGSHSTQDFRLCRSI